MKIRLMNPYHEEIYEVTESVENFNNQLSSIYGGNIEFIKLNSCRHESKSQNGTTNHEGIDCNKIVLVNPSNWALVEVEE